MDRFSWANGLLEINETLVIQQRGVRLYDGDDKVLFCFRFVGFLGYKLYQLKLELGRLLGALNCIQSVKCFENCEANIFVFLVSG